MKLIYKHNQEKHFKIITYPDGQQNIELDLEYFNNPKEPIEIVASIRNANELQIFQCLYSALFVNDFSISRITFNYLYGLRSDRRFSPGQANFVRDIIAPQLNGFKGRINILYPHSQVGLSQIWKASPLEIMIPDERGCFVIGADKNACWSERVYIPDWPHFTKIRTESSLEVGLKDEYIDQIKNLPEHTPLLIKDDLCDGGMTFIAIAAYLQLAFPTRKRYLFVAHGLFTKGVDHVAEHFDKIITTNSYQEFEPHGKLQVIDVWNA